MESSNFSLDQAILDYIGSIKNHGSLTGSDANELIDHLHDSTDALVKIGLSEQEAFIVACRRIGDVELLTDEYSKVNPSLKHNKIWAYLFIGFNMFYGISSLAIAVITLIYWALFEYFGTSGAAVSIITLFHLLFAAGIFGLLKLKHKIAYFIEIKVSSKALHWMALTSLPTILTIIGQPFLNKMIPGRSLKYLIRAFDSSLVEFSFYFAGMSILAAVVSLIFSVNNTGEFRFRNLLNAPSVAFLLLFGFGVELFSASTRMLQAENIILQAALFGLSYFTASFFLAYYNRSARNLRAVLIFASIGFLLELFVGIMADMERLNKFCTPFFVTALVVNVGVGYVLGSWVFNSSKPTATSNR